MSSAKISLFSGHFVCCAMQSRFRVAGLVALLITGSASGILSPTISRPDAVSIGSPSRKRPSTP